MYISYSPCRGMTDALQQQISQPVSEHRAFTKTSGSSLLITDSPTAH